MPMSTAPEHPFNQMARQANKLLDHLQKGFYAYSGETWTPNVNLYETAACYLVCVDLAGVEKEKIDVEIVEQQRLRLRGTRAVPSFDDVIPGSTAQSSAAQPAVQAASDSETSPRRVRIHLMEIDHGAFSREVELPLDVNRDNITANYRNGMLWIEIPKPA